MGKRFDSYRSNWARVGAVGAMALGGVSVLALTRKKPGSVRVLAVMNSITMQAHQYEEYVDPGYMAGETNSALFHSDRPENWPLNAQGLMCANWGFSALHLLPVLAPKVKWLTLPPAVLGIAQAVAHGVIMPLRTRKAYNPGALTSTLLHVPIGIASIRAIRAEGPITRGDWAKSVGVLALFFAAGVVLPNALYADRNSPYLLSEKQLGRPEVVASASKGRKRRR
ncbi:HXXEE domain-containing protein [Microbacterium phosphatis]|uniref:HXXEE domain-containing protein n=1 Tax=Microbacterium phosphatis TaxID=3140248 RepID=UPI00313FF238